MPTRGYILILEVTKSGDAASATASARHVEIRSDAVIGDRANFGFKQGDCTLYLYMHWGGEGMMDRLANALYVVIKEGRVDDPAYATRIAVSQIIGDGWAGSLGYGLTLNSLSDNEHSVPVVDWDAGTVSLYPFSYASEFKQENAKFVMPIDIFVGKFLKNIPEGLDTSLLVR